MANLVKFSDFYVVIMFILSFGNLNTCCIEAKAFFVFGDSLVDNGNNNYLATIARADYPPYGIDYPTHRPTGRFSNGLNIVDVIKSATNDEIVLESDVIVSFYDGKLGERMGWEATLPYLSPSLAGQKLLVGANFASAGVGILNDTGIQFANIIRIGQQLDYFRQYQQRLVAVIGEDETQKLVNESLTFISLGGNDFVNNYFLVPNSPRSRQYALEDYVPFIISEYKIVLQRLYELGARRVIVTGTGPLGCVPAELALHSQDGECAEELQRAATLYNPQLVDMITQLNKELGFDVFIAANIDLMNMNFISNPEAYGFTTSKIACCGQGPYNGLGLCTPISNLCPNRDLYVFWDAFHPCEKANRLIADIILNGSQIYMHPMNLVTIMNLHPEA